jgi:HD-GYP domain-containing protein (c-di-GMP phosphodiesterase class II)
VRKIPVKYLQPGMVVARTVYSDDGFILLGSGSIIKKRYIYQLEKFNITSIYVEDALLPDVEVEDVISEKTRIEAVKTVKDMLNTIKREANSGRFIIVHSKKLAKTIQNIIRDILSNKLLMVNLMDIRSTDSYTFAHSVNVAVLSILTGVAMGLSESCLYHLGIGAILHDVGKVFIPGEILNKPSALTPGEYKVIKRHSEFGLSIVEKHPQISALSKRIIYEHHERFDGTGYPQGLKGSDIHPFSQIVGMADMFDALTADRIYRKGFLPNEAYELLAGSGGRLFDYELVKVFLSHIAAYPVGTVVRLNTGEMGIVVDTPKGLSTRPTVRILFQQDRLVKEPYEIKLAENLRVLISDVINEEEMTTLKTVRTVS